MGTALSVVGVLVTLVMVDIDLLMDVSLVEEEARDEKGDELVGQRVQGFVSSGILWLS